MKSKRSKATDIPQKVKQAVWERDGGRCVVCGCCRNVMPNAHFISRSKGGLGIEENSDFSQVISSKVLKNVEQYGII